MDIIKQRNYLLTEIRINKPNGILKVNKTNGGKLLKKENNNWIPNEFFCGFPWIAMEVFKNNGKIWGAYERNLDGLQSTLKKSGINSIKKLSGGQYYLDIPIKYIELT